MNIYVISQNINNGYDTYDSAVVIAESEEKAALIHPSGKHFEDINGRGSYDWTTNPADVKVVLIGSALLPAIESVICASYNAG